MQNDVNEFVFRRKRKRLQIDVQDTETVISLDQASDGLDLGLIPTITVLPAVSSPAPAIPSSPGLEACPENDVSVERFLCSVQKAPRTKQRASGAISLRKPRAYTYTRHRAAQRRTTPVRKTIKSSQITRALFRAAVLTDGDPLDTLAEGAGISLTRRPLKFVPFNKFSSPFEQDETRECEPSDRGEDAARHTRRPSDPPGLKVHTSSSHPRTPLCLVPRQEAEAAYSLMFP